MSVPDEVRDLLEDHRYGISFPCTSGCQMRFRQNGKDLGGFYAYSQWGGIRKAVIAAMSRNRQLRALYSRRASTGKPVYRKNMEATSNTGTLGVTGSRYMDQRRNTYYFRYLVRWTDPKGKAQIKTFNLTEPFTPDQQIHALRSAIHFRKTWEMDQEGFDASRFKLWRQKRLYEPRQPDLPHGFWNTDVAFSEAG